MNHLVQRSIGIIADSVDMTSVFSIEELIVYSLWHFLIAGPEYKCIQARDPYEVL